MTIKSLAPIALCIDDPLTKRVLADALGTAGLETSSAPEGAAAVLTDDFMTAEQVREWEKSGIAIVFLKDTADVSGRLRLGNVLSRLRQGPGRAASGTLFFGSFSLDLAHLALTDSRRSTVVTLTEKERDILLRLHREKGRVLERKVLLEDIWGYASAIETHTLETHIYRLRQKIEQEPANAELLVTEGGGYKLVP